MTAEEILSASASLALTPGDRELLRFLTTQDLEEARAAWSRWLADHPLDTATPRELRVLPVVTERLLALGIDEPDMGRLRGIARFQWLWTARATRASFEAATVLAERGVDVVALKGLALHALGLTSRARRPITDGDLLVSCELDHACDSLRALGFSLRHRHPHAFTCIRGPQEELDVHCYPVHLDARSRAWTVAAAEPLRGAPFSVPSRTHLVAHACLHGVRKWTGSVLWVLDVARIVEQGGVEWERIVNLARDRCFSLALLDALGVVGDAVPQHVLQKLRTLRVSALEALEYVSLTGCLPGPWMASATRASQALRDLRKTSPVLEHRSIAAAERRIGVKWRSDWPAAWQRREPLRTLTP